MGVCQFTWPAFTEGKKLYGCTNQVLPMKKFQTRKSVEMVRYWELTTSGLKRSGCVFYLERPGHVFQTDSFGFK